MGAATIAQSAESKDDWNLVVSRWQNAIALLKTVPKSSPNYTKAQKKIPEYQRNLAYAQQQVKNPSTSKQAAVVPAKIATPANQTTTSTPASVATPKQLAPQLSRQK
jgi:predicted fused transcriptional regulator/phosphomethylpyrimidine kinase